jgi:hypothetical protein
LVPICQTVQYHSYLQVSELQNRLSHDYVSVLMFSAALNYDR